MNTKNITIFISLVIMSVTISSCEKPKENATELTNECTKVITQGNAFSFEIANPQENSSEYYRMLNAESSLWQWRAIENGEFLFDMDIIMIDNPADYALHENKDGSLLISFGQELDYPMLLSDIKSSDGTTTFTLTHHPGESYIISLHLPEYLDAKKLLIEHASNYPGEMKATGPIKDFIDRLTSAIVEMAKTFIDCKKVIEQATMKCEKDGCVPKKIGSSIICSTPSTDPNKQTICASHSTNC